MRRFAFTQCRTINIEHTSKGVATTGKSLYLRVVISAASFAQGGATGADDRSYSRPRLFPELSDEASNRQTELTQQGAFG
jgi:hypothetical protein